MPVLRSWKARIALGAAVAITGSALGLYLAFRPHPQSHPQTAPPPVATVGTTTVADPGTATYLIVLKTDPAPSAVGADVDATITLSFNLAVDPASVQNFFTMLPATEGSFAQGDKPTDVRFVPDRPFDNGSSVNVVVRKGLTSLDGSILENDFSFRFATKVDAQGVMFQSGYQVGTLLTAPPGSIDVTVQIGDDVPSDVAVLTFRATSADLVKALIHGPDGEYAKNPIDTKAMQLVDTKRPVKNADVIKVAQPAGIYLLLVSDAVGQYGSVWVDFSKFGVLLRQDDQKIVVAGIDLSTGDTNPKFDITFYRLLGKVQNVLSGSFSGTGEFPAKYPASIDLAVATSGGEDVVIPIETPKTNGDIKVMGDLSQQAAIYLTTDRAAYQKGDTVKYAGVVRFSNDQAYTIPAAMKVAIWVGDNPKLINQTAAVAGNGTFSGSFTMPPAAFNKDGSDAVMLIYASPTPPNVGSNFSAVVQALGPHTPSAKLTVSFDKPSYFAGDTIVASIAATDNSGQPLADKALKVDLYSIQRVVTPRAIANYPTPSSWGEAVNDESVEVKLDATGGAKYSFPANAANKAADQQQVTLAVRYGTGAAAALAARSTVVYQAGAEVFLLPSRSVYSMSDSVNASFVVETIAGLRIANAAMAYEFDKTDYQDDKEITTVVASGTVTTDGNGLGTISANYPGPSDSLNLVVKGKDAAGNVFQDVKSLSIFNSSSPLSGYNGADQLVQLGVTTDKIAYNVGDSARFTIKSPGPMKVLMAVERGRIHQYKWVTLAYGDNQLGLEISPDLAPGFTLVFAHMQKSAYVTEALPVFVNDPTRSLTITLTPDQATYAAGQTAHVDIAIKDSTGNPVAATVLIDGYDASMSTYKLTDQASIAGAFWLPAPRGTNASSSLVGIGDWGGRCGGGGAAEEAATTIPGQVAVWLPAVTTDATGHATVDVPLAKKTVRLAIIATTSTTSVGQVEQDLAAQ
jgi:hypothetical protein